MAERINTGRSGGQVFFSFLAGAAIGTIVGMLTAPRAGAETRRLITETARNRSTQMGRIGPALKHAYSRAAEAAQQAFRATYSGQATESHGGEESETYATTP